MRFFLFAVSMSVCVAIHADELAQLRADYANRFMEPEAHLRLSKHLEEKGERLTAFFISEAARRQYFGDTVFDPAFRAVFLGDTFDNSPAAEKRLAAAVAAEPANASARMKLADVHLSRGEWKKAEREVRAAMAQVPDEYEYVAVLEEILRRDGREKDAVALTKQWVAAHPQTRSAVLSRIEELLEAKSPEAEKAIDAALVTYPEDALLHFHRAGVLRDKDQAAAAKAYLRAAELDPKSALIQGWTARFFLKQAKDPERALHYYLNAYFLDPHFNDGEYAEGRIRELAMDRATARIGQQDLVTLLRDPDPVVIGLSMDRVDTEWKDELIEPLIALLGHDDPTLRAVAMMVLSKHMRDDARLAALLVHDDLRVRGMSAYIAAALRGEAIVPLMISWLEHPSQLIRYDAISVLAMHGGKPGRAALKKLRASGKVTEPRLREMLDTVVK